MSHPTCACFCGDTGQRCGRPAIYVYEHKAKDRYGRIASEVIYLCRDCRRDHTAGTGAERGVQLVAAAGGEG